MKKVRQPVPIETRFWNRVDQTPGLGPHGDCWEWVGPRDDYGYGEIGIGGKSTRKLKTHRFAWTLKNGPIPEGMKICHKCDNPPCVREEHLFLGTDADNIRDCKQKGRLYRPGGKPGEGNGCAKLTWERVERIREIRKLGIPYLQIARAFSVSDSQIRRICKGEAWNQQPQPQP